MASPNPNIDLLKIDFINPNGLKMEHPLISILKRNPSGSRFIELKKLDKDVVNYLTVEDGDAGSYQSFKKSISGYLKRDKNCLKLAFVKQKSSLYSHYFLRTYLTKGFCKLLNRALRSDMDFQGNKNIYLRVSGKVEITSWNGPNKEVLFTTGFEKSTDLRTLTRTKTLETICSHGNLGMGISKDVLKDNGVQRKEIRVEFQISLAWDQDITFEMCAQTFMQDLLDDETIPMDFVLVAKNGEVKCHKFVLAAQSPYFRAMLSPSNDAKELTGRSENREVSEEALTILVRYLYGFEISSGELQCEIALELLKTAQFYQIHDLVESISDLLLNMGKSWYTTGMLLGLYLFAKQVKEMWELGELSLIILTERQKEVRNSEEFKDLNRQDIIDLVNHFFPLR